MCLNSLSNFSSILFITSESAKANSCKTERRVLSRMREAQKRQARMFFGLKKCEHGESEEKAP